jgi:hypothetical protein
MRRERLRMSRLPVTEEPPFVRSHLEDPEVLAVAGGRRQAGLAPGDRDRLLRIPAEYRPDGSSRRGSGEPAGLPALLPLRDESAEVGRLLPHPRKAPMRAGERLSRARGVVARAQEGAAVLEEADRPAKAASGGQLSFEEESRARA